ncbi:hypothetical protein P3W55_13340 [Pseudomonas citronellolis]|uniref:Uncharacterized protein n=1 Tax=Pseudomonas citronellolis TaxID=53408 RepID=A0AAW6P6L5_9PSED|nr:hypothetical protein [Pseudomonas citronellolis]MDF3842694.1 hypothetical protein [Pseudomonas citronellolis]
MKRKPTTKQTVKAELIRLVRADLIEAREGRDTFTIDTARGRAFGAIRLAYLADVINDTEYRALSDLTHSTHDRAFELIYGAPPYTGKERAKALRAADKAAA